MWSVGRERCAVYLGYGAAFWQRAGHETAVLSHAPTWPLARVLHGIAELARADGGNLPRAVLDVRLGAFYCPAVRCDVPAVLGGHADREAFVRYTVARAMQMPEDELVVAAELDHDMALASGMPRRLHGELAAWCADIGARMDSVAPVWSVATDCRLARRASIRAVAIREPGFVTLLTRRREEPDMHGDGVLSHAMVDTSVSASADDPSRLQLRLQMAVGTALTDGPRPWARHWSVE